MGIYYRLVIIASIFVGTVPSSLNAGGPLFTANLGVSFADFEYQETDESDRTLDKESGLFPELNLSLRLDSESWFMLGDLRYFEGTADYTAYPISQPPVESTTEEEVIDFSLLFGVQQALSDTVTLALYGGLGFRYWERDIQSTPDASGLYEEYEWGYMLIGISPAIRIGPSDRIGVDLQLRKAFDASLEVGFKNLPYDRVNIPLDDGIGFRLALNWNHELSEGFEFTLGPYVELWEFARSADVDLKQGNVTVASVHEPASKTELVGIRFFFTKYF